MGYCYNIGIFYVTNYTFIFDEHLHVSIIAGMINMYYDYFITISRVDRPIY